MIWFDKELSIEKLKPLGPNTMAAHIGIEWVEVGKISSRLKCRSIKELTSHMDYCMVVLPASWQKHWEV